MAIQTGYVFKSQGSHHLHNDRRFLLAMYLASPIPRKRARIEIIPLIDIMFFLLASFMMVSLSQTHMKGIKVALPSATAPPPSQVKDYVAMQVREGNAVYLDGQYVSEDQVLPRLFALHQENPGIKVSISATMLALHGDVIAVLDKVRRVGITKVGYQIRAAQPGAAAPAAGNPPPPPPPH
jgi:biopolymer transport protein ExbD